MIESLIISLPMMVCVFCTLLVALRWYDSHLQSLPRLLVFYGVTTVLYLAHYAYFGRLSSVLPVTESVYTACNLAVYPLFLNYVLSVTGRRHEGLENKPHLVGWLLLPAIVAGTLTALCYAMMDSTALRQFVQGYLYGQPHDFHGWALVQVVIHIVCKIVFAVLVVIVLVVALRESNAYDRHVNNSYADAEHMELKRLRTLLYLQATVSLLSFVANAVGRHFFESHQSLLAVPSVLFSLLLFLLAYSALTLRMPPVETVAVPVPQQKADQPEVSLTDVQIKALSEQLVTLLKDEHLYLESDLRVSQLAQRMGTNRLYLSRAINEQLGTTFANLINRMRIDHAIQLMKEQPDMPLVEVAEKSGYQSQASFFRNFKTLCGCTPKNYQF